MPLQMARRACGNYLPVAQAAGSRMAGNPPRGRRKAFMFQRAIRSASLFGCDPVARATGKFPFTLQMSNSHRENLVRSATTTHGGTNAATSPPSRATSFTSRELT